MESPTTIAASVPVASRMATASSMVSDDECASAESGRSLRPLPRGS